MLTISPGFWTNNSPYFWFHRVGSSYQANSLSNYSQILHFAIGNVSAAGLLVLKVKMDTIISILVLLFILCNNACFAVNRGGRTEARLQKAVSSVTSWQEQGRGRRN